MTSSDDLIKSNFISNDSKYQLRLCQGTRNIDNENTATRVLSHPALPNFVVVANDFMNMRINIRAKLI